MSGDNLLQCYNRGCGQKFDPADNKDDSCRHHPGQPVFHDAYKGWSCCNKKCTDFTEFLNIKGCTLSRHSNVKPPEPEKPKTADIPDTEVIEVKPIVPSALPRPSFDSPLTKITPEIAPSLKQAMENGTLSNSQQNAIKEESSTEVAIGTVCKNGACNVSYEGPQTDETTCTHHPGVPIFHEGMKYWSCCQRKTSDFNAFLQQAGCSQGKHVWIKQETENKVNCRWDYHQTASHVVVSIYAKQYCPQRSEIKLNPIRLYVNLIFPQQNDATFHLDLELRGIVNVEASQVSMFGTKVEIRLKKAEPGSWTKLEIPRNTTSTSSGDKKPDSVDKITPQIDAVDLSDL